jgi:hypothetical protein
MGLFYEAYNFYILTAAKSPMSQIARQILVNLKKCIGYYDQSLLIDNKNHNIIVSSNAQGEKRDCSMKRAKHFIIGILFLAIVLPLSAQAAQLVGNISKLKGTAQIFREEVPSPITAYVGIPLYLHDRVPSSKTLSLLYSC